VKTNYQLENLKLLSRNCGHGLTTHIYDLLYSRILRTN